MPCAVVCSDDSVIIQGSLQWAASTDAGLTHSRAPRMTTPDDARAGGALAGEYEHPQLSWRLIVKAKRVPTHCPPTRGTSTTARPFRVWWVGQRHHQPYESLGGLEPHITVGRCRRQIWGTRRGAGCILKDAAERRMRIGSADGVPCGFRGLNMVRTGAAA